MSSWGLGESNRCTFLQGPNYRKSHKNNCVLYLSATEKKKNPQDFYSLVMKKIVIFVDQSHKNRNFRQSVKKKPQC